MRKVIILLSILLLITACRTTKQTKTEIKTVVTERIVETVRDSIITLPADSSWLMAYLECDSIGRVNITRILDYESGKRSSIPKISIDNNVLTARNQCDSLELIIKLYDKFIEWKELNQESKIETIYINKLKAWQTVFICMGFGFIFLVLYNIYKFLKNIFNGRKN